MASLQKKSLIATAAIFCCRFTGLLRELTYTALFGATGALDAFLTAFRVPNMLRDMFAEGALSQSFTSVMSKVEKQDGSRKAWELTNRVVSQLCSLMLCLVASGVLLSGVFMQWLYPERVRVCFVGSPPAGDSTWVPAVYRGMERDADGRKTALFQVSSLPQGVFSTSCLRAEPLEQAKQGEEFILFTGKSPAGKSGLLKLEERSYLGLATDLCRLMWPFILLASVSALCMGALNVFGIFGVPNLASAAFNMTVIVVGCAVGWLIDPRFGADSLYGFAVAVVLGGAAQVAVQIPKLRQNGYRPAWNIGISWRRGRFSFDDDHVRRIWRLMLPGVIAAGITQANVFINTSFALYLPSGAVTALSCAFHLWQLPVALFGVAVGMVVLPSVSRLALEGEGEKRSRIPSHLAQAMRFMLFFAVPSAVLLGFWGEEVVSVFFQRGRFDAEAAAITGSVLSAYSLGLLGYAGMKVLQPVFLALEKPWAPAVLALFSCGISLSLNYVFVFVFQIRTPMWLALTTSVVTTLNFLFYFLYLRRLLGSMACRELLPGVLRLVLSGGMLALGCWFVQDFCFAGFTGWSFSMRLAALALGGAGVGAVYVAAAFFCRVPELRMLRSYIGGRKV